MLSDCGIRLSETVVPRNGDPPCTTLGDTGPLMGPGWDKLGAPVREGGLILSRSVCRDGRRSLEEGGAFVCSCLDWQEQRVR